MIANDFYRGRALKIAIISLILLSITVNAKGNISQDFQKLNDFNISNNISQGFQRLNDVYLIDDTNMKPRYILEHIKETNRAISNVPKEYLPIDRKITTNILATQTQQDITFTGNFRQLWNYSAGNTNITYGQVVEDLDGDGLDDILITTYGIESGIYYYTVQAKKGKDGNILWQKSISGTNTWIYVHPAGDMNGDGLNDVYMTITDSQSPYISTVQVMEGNNGGILWQENANGGINVLSLGEYWDFSLTEYPVGDLDGDGIYDILLDIGGSTLKAKKGINGIDLWEESVINGAITSYPAGDLNGDGTNDVLLNIYDRNVSTHTVKAKKGIDGQDLWQETDFWIGSMITGDLDGDGLNDILLHRSVLNAFRLEFKKGIDGNVLWTDNNGIPANGMPAKDLDGDGLVDLFIYSYDNNLLKATLKAKKGIDGQDLWQEIRDVIDYEFYPIEDLNGDGMNDVLLGVYDNNLPSLKAKKGIDGQDLWQTDIHPITIDAVGDLNGDGTNDIVQRIEAYPCEDGPCILKATKGIDGQDLWQEIVANGNGEIYLNNAGDLNGDMLNDLVEEVHDWNTGTYILKAKNGKYGTDIWSAESSTLNTAKHISDLDGDGLNDMLLWSNDKMYLVSSTHITRFINGTVMDSVNKTALSGVTVSTNTNLSNKTDAKGFYSFSVTEGEYNLTAKLEPTYYANNTISVSTIESDVVQNIELLKKPIGTITGKVTGTLGGSS